MFLYGSLRDRVLASGRGHNVGRHCLGRGHHHRLLLELVPKKVASANPRFRCFRLFRAEPAFTAQRAGYQQKYRDIKQFLHHRISPFVHPGEAAKTVSQQLAVSLTARARSGIVSLDFKCYIGVYFI